VLSWGRGEDTRSGYYRPLYYHTLRAGLDASGNLVAWQHRIVGQSIPRYDIPGKVDGSVKWAVDVKLPGMVHARHVRPPIVGAKLVSVDEASIRDVPGVVKVVTRGNYVAVVCEREEQAIQAARQLKVNWQKPATAAFPSSEDLFTYMRGATPTFGR